MTKGPRKRQPAGPNAKGVFPRSASRLAAVQALYQMDMASTDINTVIEEFIGQRLPEAPADDPLHAADTQFFADIVRGVVRRQRDIDPAVDQTLATGWRLVRVDSILRAILRAATFELIERTDVPGKVVINEYINVAKAFFTDDEPRVVNGVLDKLAHGYRASELGGNSSGHGAAGSATGGAEKEISDG
jgi:N utilization substance protein B